MNKKISELNINPEYEKLVPRVTADEYATMKDSIKLHGIREPIVINEKNIVIDGHTRIQIAKELGLIEIPCRVESYPTLYLEKKAVIEYNLHRRQLNTAQKCELGLMWLEIETKEAEERKLSTLKQNQNLENESEEVILLPRDNPLKTLTELTTGITEILSEPTWEPNMESPEKLVDSLIESIVPNQMTDIEKENITTNILGKAMEKAAEKVGVSASTLQHYKKMSEAAKTNPGLQKEKEQALNGTKSVNKVFNTAKQLEKREAKKIEIEQKSLTLPKTSFETQIKLSEIKDCAQYLQPNSVDLILTDPPYGEEYLPVWEELGKLAQKVLKEGGLLITYSGHSQLPAIYSLLGKYLTYTWTFALMHTGSLQSYMPYNLEVGWKPILFYRKGKYHKREGWFKDVIQGAGRAKDHHDWEQPVGEAEFLLKYFTDEQDLVVDPCIGSGTTMVACHKLKRQYRGFDKDELCIKQTKVRLQELVDHDQSK